MGVLGARRRGVCVLGVAVLLAIAAAPAPGRAQIPDYEKPLPKVSKDPHPFPVRGHAVVVVLAGGAHATTHMPALPCARPARRRRRCRKRQHR